ncbi:MAG: hypothetical protein IJB94_01350 [Clostridia bacterium]|nr:hypothetical protein [Clostridia bacterium]
MAKKTITGAYEALPKIAKVILQLIFGAIIGGVYRILRYIETKNTVTLIVGILALIPPIDVVFWILDLITEALNDRISILAD